MVHAFRATNLLLKGKHPAFNIPIPHFFYLMMIIREDEILIWGSVFMMTLSMCLLRLSQMEGHRDPVWNVIEPLMNWGHLHWQILLEDGVDAFHTSLQRQWETSMDIMYSYIVTMSNILIDCILDDVWTLVFLGCCYALLAMCIRDIRMLRHSRIIFICCIFACNSLGLREGEQLPVAFVAGSTTVFYLCTCVMVCFRGEDTRDNLFMHVVIMWNLSPVMAHVASEPLQSVACRFVLALLPSLRQSFVLSTICPCLFLLIAAVWASMKRSMQVCVHVHMRLRCFLSAFCAFVIRLS